MLSYINENRTVSHPRNYEYDWLAAEQVMITHRARLDDCFIDFKMSLIVSAVLKLTFGVLANKFRSGDVTDEECRLLIIKEIDDIKYKLDGLTRKDLLSSVCFLQEGINRLYQRRVCFTGHGSQVTGHRSRVTGHGSRVTGHRSQVTGHRSRVTGHGSQVTGHGSQVTGHRSRVTGHGSQVTGHRSLVAGHRFMSTSTPVMWSLSLQQGIFRVYIFSVGSQALPPCGYCWRPFAGSGGF